MKHCRFTLCLALSLLLSAACAGTAGERLSDIVQTEMQGAEPAQRHKVSAFAPELGYECPSAEERLLVDRIKGVGYKRLERFANFYDALLTLVNDACPLDERERRKFFTSVRLELLRGEPLRKWQDGDLDDALSPDEMRSLRDSVVSCVKAERGGQIKTERADFLRHCRQQNTLMDAFLRDVEVLALDKGFLGAWVGPVAQLVDVQTEFTRDFVVARALQLGKPDFQRALTFRRTKTLLCAMNTWWHWGNEAEILDSIDNSYFGWEARQRLRRAGAPMKLAALQDFFAKWRQIAGGTLVLKANNDIGLLNNRLSCLCAVKDQDEALKIVEQLLAGRRRLMEDFEQNPAKYSVLKDASSLPKNGHLPHNVSLGNGASRPSTKSTSPRPAWSPNTARR